MGTKPINNIATFFFLVVLLSYASLGLSLQQTTIDDLQYYKRLLLTAVVGPESLAFDRDGGGPYTGVSDGRIVKWHGTDRGWADFAVPSWNRDQECNGGHYLLREKICGRPLGLQFYGATGELFVADSTFGLLRIDREGGLATIIANEAEGVPFHFTNGLDVDQENGMVYFTDSSTTFFRWDYALLVMSGEATGRLMRYNPTNNQLTVLLRGVAFPNGVALSRDNAFLVYAETTNRRVVKYWLRGPNAGSSEPFADNLPGFPDNVKRNSKGEFWVALSDGNPTGWDALADRAVAVRLSEEGVVVEVKEDEVRIMRSVSEVLEVNGTLWIGSVDNPFVGVCEL